MTPEQMENLKEKSLVAFFIAMVLIFMLVAIVWPFAIIWAINTLVPVAAIAYNFWSWLAVVVINTTYLLPRVNFKKD
jgi:hypothetical protein